MGLTICQTCGIIVRGNHPRRCSSCKGYIARNSPTPLSSFGLKESAPIGAVKFQSDHLLLERVLEISHTDKLIWNSPCKHGECSHEEKMAGSLTDEPQEPEATDSQPQVHKPQLTDPPEPENEPALLPRSESSGNGTGETPRMDEKPVVESEPGAKPNPEAKPTEKPKEKPEPEVEPVHQGLIKQDEEMSSWILTATGISADGVRKGIEVALEDVGSEPMPDAQSFSATTLVFGPALDERVITAEPQDLKAHYEASLKAETEKSKTNDVKADSDQKDEKDVDDIVVVEQTASAIFDKPQVGGSDRDYSEELKAELGKHEPAKELPPLDAELESDTWPDEDHARGVGKKTKNDSEEKASPYESQFDLSQLKRPGPATVGDETRQLPKPGLGQSMTSMITGFLKVAAILVVFLLVGGVGLYVLGSKPAVKEATSIQTNQLGLPILTGNWNLKLWVETASGDVSYGEVDTPMVQTQNKVSGQGKDGNGNYSLSGSLGKTDQNQVMIVFTKQYDLSDGRQHPYPIRFRGVVGIEPGSNVVAQGSFANRLMQDMPSLNKKKFEQIQGYWSLTIQSESAIGKLKKMVGF